MTEYRAVARPEARSWAVEVDGVGVTQCAHVEEAHAVALDLVLAMTGNADALIRLDVMAPPTLLPPPPLGTPRDGTLRFRLVGGGLSSATWTVKARSGQRQDDVYIAPRARMTDLKLSLHDVVTWRLAYTHEATGGLPGDARLLYEWPVPQDISPGWKQACTIVIPTSTLFDDVELDLGKVQSWPAPAPGWGLRFDVLLMEPDHGELTIEGPVREVGRIGMRSGRTVIILATQAPVDPVYEAGLRQARGSGSAPEDWSAPRGWAWGWSDEHGHPVLVDLGAMHRP